MPLCVNRTPCGCFAGNGAGERCAPVLGCGSVSRIFLLKVSPDVSALWQRVSGRRCAAAFAPARAGHWGPSIASGHARPARNPRCGSFTALRCLTACALSVAAWPPCDLSPPPSAPPGPGYGGKETGQWNTALSDRAATARSRHASSPSSSRDGFPGFSPGIHRFAVAPCHTTQRPTGAIRASMS